jgi:hypothetical protein
MPLYTIYPFRADGCATTLLCAELEDDRAALVYARWALADHPSASHAVVLEGEREVARTTAAPAFEAQPLQSA